MTIFPFKFIAHLLLYATMIVVNDIVITSQGFICTSLLFQSHPFSSKTPCLRFPWMFNNYMYHEKLIFCCCCCVQQAFPNLSKILWVQIRNEFRSQYCFMYAVNLFFLMIVYKLVYLATWLWMSQLSTQDVRGCYFSIQKVVN